MSRKNKIINVVQHFVDNNIKNKMKLFSVIVIFAFVFSVLAFAPASTAEISFNGGPDGGVEDPCLGVSCPNYCSGNTRYYNGWCDPDTGDCEYTTEACGTGYCTDSYYCDYEESKWTKKEVSMQVCYKFTCLPGSCYKTRDDKIAEYCGSSYPTNTYRCSGSTLQRKWVTGGCNLNTGKCGSGEEWLTVADCGSSGWGSSYRCSDSSLQRLWVNKWCDANAGSCKSSDEWKEIEGCSDINKCGSWYVCGCYSDGYVKECQDCTTGVCINDKWGGVYCDSESSTNYGKGKDCSGVRYSSNYCYSGHVYRDRYDGYCSGGTCRESSTMELVQSCSWGCNAATATCNPDPCAGVSCGNICSGDTFKYNGYCKNGNCYYSSSTNCNDYDECTSNYCGTDGNVYKTCDDGYCTSSGCKISTTTTKEATCSYGCSGGACKGNPCAGVTCPNYCSGSSLMHSGSCDSGTGKCLYATTPCGGNYYEDNRYCCYSNTKVCSTGHYRGCSGGSCYDTTYDNIVQTCGSGSICENGACKSTCSDDCSTSGQTRCLNANTKQTCGNYDSDTCLEWGGDTACLSGCSGGSCIDPGTCTCRGSCDWGVYIGTEETNNCNTGAGYYPVCTEKFCPMDTSYNLGGGQPCTCKKDVQCSYDWNCIKNSDRWVSFQCFGCSGGDCWYASKGTACSRQCITIPEAPGCTNYKGRCDGQDRCTCWEGMDCEDNTRCDICDKMTESDYYCASNHCCPKGSEWDSRTNTCKPHNPCKGSLSNECNYEQLTSGWFGDSDCQRYTPKPYEEACCNVGTQYGTPNWYDWKGIELLP